MSNNSNENQQEPNGTSININSDTSDCGCGCADCSDKDTKLGFDAQGNPVNLAKEARPEDWAYFAQDSQGLESLNSFNLTDGTLAATAARPQPPSKVEPGKWVALPQQQNVDVETAKRDIESRPAPANLYIPGGASAPLSSAIKSLAAGFAGNTIGGPASIVELARALKSDVDLIYEWVYNNVENLPTYGIQKGGLGSIIDGYGNSFDQADLLIQLLRQAGYTANYQFGELRMTAAQAGAWLGTDPTNIWASANLLSNSGVPNSTFWTGTEWVVDFSHCWVLCTIGGTNYVFDASMKTYTTKAKIDLATAMGYNATTFLNRAKTGATVTADYVQNLNRTNIRADLDSMTMNLVNWIKTNNHGAAMDDIIGGRNIVQNDASTPQRITSHPYLKSGTTPTTWTAVPQAYKATMHVIYDTIDVTFNTHDLAGKRLTLTFNGSHQGELRLEGTLIGTSSAQTPGSWNSVLFDIVHPYPFSWANQYVWETVWADKPYLLCNSWGNISPSSINVHSKKVKELIANIAALDGEAMIGESMAQMWKTMDSGVSRMADIFNRLSNCTTTMHHQCGLIGWFDTVFTDIGAITWSTSALDNNYSQQVASDTALALHGVALEAQMMKEFMNAPGISSTSVLDTAAQAGQIIYDGKTANWTSNVKPNLVGYSAGDLTNIENWWINAGDRVAIPQNAPTTINNWTGFGYNAIPSWGTFGIISGGLKGGSASRSMALCTLSYQFSAWTWDVFVTNPYPDCDCTTLAATYKNSSCFPWLGSGGMGRCVCWVPAGSLDITGSALPGGGNGVGGGGGGGSSIPGTHTSAEPIDLATGAYLYDATDLTIGSAGFPYGLAFSRSYSSDARNQHGPLGRGWRHNFQIYAGRDTSGLSGMGEQTVLGAAGTIVEAFVSYDLQSDSAKPFDKYMTNVLTSMWFVDNLSDNVVMMQSGFSSRMFVKLPDGTYTAPAGESGSITKNVDDTYTYTSLTGTKMNFNSFGHIATWVEPFGVTVTFNYDTTGKLQTVSNGLGRTLTLSYGTDNQLASVSDGTGRSVSYTLDSSMNLTTVTDPNGKNWTYEYDQPGRMTKLYKPANPTTPVVTNTYDSLHRVKEQRDYQLNVWQYFFAGARSEEVNPNNKNSVLYFNNMGRAVKAINQLGQKATSVFDGRNRLVKAIAPEGNSVEFVYNVKDLVTQTTAKAKPASGLADIVSSATYDTTWQKLKTATDPMGRVTTMNYDPANGNLLSVVSPSVTGLGSSTVSMTYNGRGQILTVTGPDGIVTKNTYDVTTEKLLSTVHDFGVGRLNLTVNFGYDSVGNATSVQDPRGFTSTAVFDVLRRVTQATTTAPWSFVTKFTYDDNGNTTKVERQTNDPANPWQTTQATYTVDNKVQTAIDAQGNTTTITYDNLQRQWKVTDAIGRVVTNVFDDANRISSVIDPAGITAVTYTFTTNGLVATIKDARNLITTNSFDGHDRALRTTYPDSTYEEITSRDGNSNPLILTTRSGATVTLTYDELNRVKTKTPTGQPTVTTVYDIAGRVTTVSTPVVAGDPSSGTFTNFYDTAGRFYKEQYPDGLSVIHELDANGNATKMTYPDGYYISRVFDELNRLTDIKLNGAGTSAVQFQYDALSRRIQTSYENGCTTNYGFEMDSDLSSLRLNFVGSNVIFNYGFDDVNRMVRQGSTDPANFRWTPGAPGTTSYGAANNLNQYPTVGGVSQTYSTDGCLTNDGTFKYEFNSERMLTRVRNAGTNAIISDYLYDPMQRQRQKNVGGVKTNFYYAGFQRLADYDGTTNALQDRYVYGAGLDEVLIKVSSAGVKTYYHANHQGSVIATTDASGAVLNRYKYGPFGESAALSGTTHGYTGQRVDAETGNYYYKMRYYSPKLGRFLQPDPLNYTDGLNIYCYVSNSPLNRVDSLGLAADGGSGDSGGSTVDGGGIWDTGALDDYAPVAPNAKLFPDGVTDYLAPRGTFSPEAFHKWFWDSYYKQRNSAERALFYRRWQTAGSQGRHDLVQKAVVHYLDSQLHIPRGKILQNVGFKTWDGVSLFADILFEDAAGWAVFEVKTSWLLGDLVPILDSSTGFDNWKEWSSKFTFNQKDAFPRMNKGDPAYSYSPKVPVGGIAINRIMGWIFGFARG